jgi:acetyl-CoA C-acetyltransferase|tara:strand:- start:3144 stop:4319 length:1176 start_codon:yes stop_codon:yes gene_type:complete
MNEVVITGATRTPVGSFNGTLSSLSAANLGAIAISEALKRSNVDAKDVDEVVLGQVLTAATGMNPARQALLSAGIPDDRTAYLVNQVCGSGLRSVAQAFQAIKVGDSGIVVAGGQESMSQAPHATHMRNGTKMGDTKLVDTMIKDGLWCSLMGYHMGHTAENVAQKWQITRDEQDEFAANSQQKAEAAQKEGRFNDEITPVTIKTRKGDVLCTADEYPRSGTTLETLSKLSPAFDKEGTVTAGNASGINDGAAALVLMSLEESEKRQIKPIARIASWATAGVDPAVMGSGPIPASQKALQKAGWSIEDVELVEANEAFAAQAIAVNRDLGWNPGIVNVNGGAIAIGHPIGASGGRILVTLLYEMNRRKAKKGLATLCIGGGMGIAMCVECD